MDVMTDSVMTIPSGAGHLLRDWRERRGLSQLELSNRTGISSRHVSFVETGRSTPSPELIHRLGEELDIPLRHRNQILTAAGHAPRYPQRAVDAPELAVVRRELSAMIAAMAPNPAVIIDRHWNLVEANACIGPLLDGCAAHLLQPPVNVLRLGLHPDGIARRVTNFAEWSAHLMGQVRRRAAHTGDAELVALAAELEGYLPDGTGHHDSVTVGTDAVVLPLRLDHPDGELAFFSVDAALTSARDVTVEELTVEIFSPADAATAEFLRRVASA
ncbi:helix-turn-helix transcriptional regulator [Gordonia desulfuricans]|uniref:Helix-turn-helix transcriptional regulator n=2 Tax=Gordonia desulfuricans TaxID=89051 RepID=A0A7K3LL51_9ACTN|nr:helix-turn-helix transcriptional regulator [Gordonia desulfuricans]